MKSVAIIGGGPAGLVAAKTLLHHSSTSPFRVTIFEKKDRLGGMWAVEQGGHGDKCSPDMQTNLSRFTVAFSDLDWSDVIGIKSKEQRSGGHPADDDAAKCSVPMFPNAWMVGKYLSAYATKYIPVDTVKLGCEVVRTELCRSKDADRRKWQVEWRRNASQVSAEPMNGADPASQGTKVSGGTTEKGSFDYLIIASGFFAAPRKSASLLRSKAQEKGFRACQSLHSSQYRDLSSIGISATGSSGGNVVIVGGSMSGVECASTIASHLSDMRWSPRSSKDSKIKVTTPVYKIHHVASRPFYVLPRYLPATLSNTHGKSSRPRFLPLDLVLYDLSRRADKPICPNNGLMAEERAIKMHAYLRDLSGCGQVKDGEVGKFTLTEEDEKLPTYVALSDTYLEYLRTGDIILHQGRASAVQADQPNHGPNGKSSGISTTVIKADRMPETITDVIAYIDATGFVPAPAISFLSNPVLHELDFDTSCERIPILLKEQTTFASRIAEIAFVGFYEGPYWGVLEMQARLIAQRWSEDTTPMPRTEEPDDRMLAVRQGLLSNSSRVPQFWMGDYVGLMEGFARDLQIPRLPLDGTSSPSSNPSGPVVPARYPLPPSSSSAASLAALRSTLAQSQSGRFVAAAAFAGLHGRWMLRRTLTSFLPGFPSGTLEGTAWLHPRAPTHHAFDAEYLYVEEGRLMTDSGLELHATKRYAYRYCEARDEISAFFVADDGLTVAEFFNRANLDGREDAGTGRAGDGCWVANGSHLCERDLYESTYEFRFVGARLEGWSVKYVVKGPRKDYVSDTRFSRE